MITLVGNGHPVEFIVSCIEVKGSKVHPCTATHLLVYMKLGTFPTMPYRIKHIIYAVRKCLVTHIDRIPSGFSEIRLVNGLVIARLAVGGFCHTGATRLKWILSVGIGAGVPRESWQGCLFPSALCRNLNVVALRTVVVHNNLFFLPIAFTWCKHDGSGLFEHGNQIRHHNCLGKQILGGSKEFGTLPSPIASFLVVVSSMTGP